MISAGLNGLGRFGQHLLHAWLKNPGVVLIDYACDARLSAEAVCQLLIQHDRLDFSEAAPEVVDGNLCLTRADGVRQRVAFHYGPAPLAPWLGLPDVWLECSGRHPNARDCHAFIVGRTRQVIVSATCWDADQTLVVGFNHASWRPQSQVISYGSCTVNSFVPLASWLHETYVVLEAQANVIHNVPAHSLTENTHPRRSTCTLEKMAPRLLPWLAPARFFVSYTLIPYTGASLIDFRFRIGTSGSHLPLIEALRKSPLQSRYALLDADPGVVGAIGSPCNAVFFADGITLEGDTLRMSGYFDNENSAVRYLELVQWAAERF